MDLSILVKMDFGLCVLCAVHAAWTSGRPCEDYHVVVCITHAGDCACFFSTSALLASINLQHSSGLFLRNNRGEDRGFGVKIVRLFLQKSNIHI